MSLESEFGTEEFGARVWSLGQSLGQSLGPASGVWVRVWGQNLESGRSLESGQRARVWSLGQSLGQSAEPEFGIWVRVWVKVWGQSLESGSVFGSEFRTRVWSLGSESEFRHPEPNPDMGFGQSLESSFGSEFGPGFGSEFRARSKFGVRVWSLGQGLGLARAGSQSLGQSLTQSVG